MQSQDPIKMLKDDHKHLKKLLKELESTTPRAVKKRAELLARVKAELKVHTTIEEEIFYPAFRAAGGKEELKLYHEAREEHRAVEKLVLPDLSRTNAGGEMFGGRAKVLKELIEHHADEEEEEMFPKARKMLTADELAGLAEKMAQKKSEMKSAFH